MGFTHDDRQLIMSDGSSKLRFLDPATFAELNRLEVFDGDKRIENLNELELSLWPKCLKSGRDCGDVSCRNGLAEDGGDYLSLKAQC